MKRKHSCQHRYIVAAYAGQQRQKNPEKSVNQRHRCRTLFNHAVQRCLLAFVAASATISGSTLITLAAAPRAEPTLRSSAITVFMLPEAFTQTAILLVMARAAQLAQRQTVISEALLLKHSAFMKPAEPTACRLFRYYATIEKRQRCLTRHRLFSLL